MRVTSIVSITPGLVASRLLEADPLLTGTTVYRLITYTNNTKDFMVPQLWGQVRTALVLSRSPEMRVVSCHVNTVSFCHSPSKPTCPYAVMPTPVLSPNSIWSSVPIGLRTPTLIRLLPSDQVDKRDDPYAPQQSGGCCTVM